MLQRKQTLWMLAALICAVLTFWLPFYTGNVVIGANGHEFRQLRAWPTYINGASGSMLILIVTILMVVGIGYDIVIYKNRGKQLWVTIGLIVLSLLNIFLYWHASRPPAYVEGGYSLSALLSLAIPVFLIFAARGIRKDEKLIRSADRLR
jgi:putative copper export protein